MKTISEHCENNTLVIPQALSDMEDVTTLMRNGNSIIFYKNLESDLLDVEFYSNSRCIIYIESGNEIITTNGNEIFELNPGDACLLP